MNDQQPTSPVERITKAAMTLVAERGMSGVTMSAVAERACVSRQTVYNHFTGIDAIILAAHGSHTSTDPQGGMLLGTAATATEKIDLLIRHTIAVSGSMGGAVAVDLGLGPAARDELRRHARESRDLIASILRDGMEAGEFRNDLDPEVDARLIQGAMAAAGEAAAEPGGDVPRISAAAIRAILAMLDKLSA